VEDSRRLYETLAQLAQVRRSLLAAALYTVTFTEKATGRRLRKSWQMITFLLPAEKLSATSLKIFPYCLLIYHYFTSLSLLNCAQQVGRFVYIC
jgi:hypothetical protein